jgi:hypothetical protein
MSFYVLEGDPWGHHLLGHARSKYDEYSFARGTVASDAPTGRRGGWKVRQERTTKRHDTAAKRKVDYGILRNGESGD